MEQEWKRGNQGNCFWLKHFGEWWFLFLRWEAVGLGVGNGSLLFGHDKLEMLSTAVSGHQGRGSGCGYKFGNSQLIVRTQYREE